MSRACILGIVVAGMLKFISLPASAQRVYADHSVLATGNWFKFKVKTAGIYRLDLPFLSSLGLNTGSLASNSIRIFGNSGWMLPETANGPKHDDLFENAIQVVDGGDGILNGSDYIIFYASGPQRWLKDSVNKSFNHQKNLYSDDAFYYISAGGTGKRVAAAPPSPAPNLTVSEFTNQYFYELDTFNFLSSGREWYGEEFSDAPGKLRNRNFTFSIPGISGRQALIRTQCLARSFGSSSRFTVHINNQPVLQSEIFPVQNGPYDLYARDQLSAATFVPADDNLTINFDYTPGSFGSQGWLDWFEILARRNLSMNGVNQLSFRDWNSVGAGNSGEFIIANATPSTQVWEVTNPLEPTRLATTMNGANLHFVNRCDILREYIAFNNTDFLVPEAAGRVTNQDLHNRVLTDMLLVTHPSLLAQANVLAEYHRQRQNMNITVVTTEQVYNEFSSGSPDPVAIRDFAKMFYDRADGDSTKSPKYLLLFGDASFDYKNRITNNTNLVPSWESPVSADPLSTYTSDDFFGFLDDADDINGSGTYLLDIGIGRIPAATGQQAKSIVDKIIAYHSPASLGPWRNELTFVADDEDNNLHLQDAEIITNAVGSTTPDFNNDKIYLDAFHQQSGSGGARYPEVNQAISNDIFNGTLIWNYTGHGGYRRLAEEVVLDQDIINTFNNPQRLPLFLTATCDFAPYDNPLVSSIGENLLLREKTGAIALMTTTRLVFAFSNRVMNENYLRTALQRQSDGRYLSLGEAVRRAKNTTYTFFGDVVNNRKFTLLGDPALTLGYPVYRVSTTAINSVPVSATPDTLKAMSQYSVSGVVQDLNGNVINDFNGTVYSTVFDKAQTINTLGNDPGSLVVPVQVQRNLLFKGKAKVNNGQFTINFIVPKDINYQFGKGKISYYTDNGATDGNGAFTDIIIGGSGNGINDDDGPEIKAYMNDEKFINGGITNNRPILLVKLADSSGINIMGTGIGHDLVAMLDNNPEKQFVLNEFYESELDNFKRGTARFQMPDLAAGWHTLTIKAWDAVNNSGEVTIEFRVVMNDRVTLEHVLNYPNPFTTNTSFWFDHNRAGEELKVSVEIYTITGKLVKTIRQTIFSTGNRSSEVQWNGRDDYGNRIGRGVYIYRLKVQAADGKAAEKLEKLYIL
jgi:hypothetical protein